MNTIKENLDIKVYLGAADIWDFFLANRERLESEQVLIASAGDGTSIFLTSCSSAGPLLLLTVEIDGVKRVWRYATDRQDAEDSAMFLYKAYLLQAIRKPEQEPESKSDYGPKPDDDPVQEDPPLTETERTELIDEREDELLSSFLVFLSTLVKEEDASCVEKLETDELMDALDNTLRGIAEDLLLPVYRPTFYDEPDTGAEVFVEYPYSDEALTL